MSFKVGLQLFTVRDEMEKDPLGTLRAVRDMGYDGVEVCNGSYGIDPVEFRTFCDEIGLRVISAHMGVGSIIDETDKTLELYKTLGVSNVAISGFWGDYAYNGKDHKAMMARLKEKAAYFAQNGIGVLYHNHETEFRLDGDKYILDCILDTFGNDDLLPEIDVCWATIGNGNAAEYMRKYNGRCPIVHLKDFYCKGSYHYPDNNYERPKDFAFRPVGYGRVDMVEALDAAIEIGASWVIVEQDDAAFGLTALECAKKSREWLATQGF